MAQGLLTADEIPPEDTDGYKPATSDFIDGLTFDGKDPLAYLATLPIGNKD